MPNTVHSQFSPLHVYQREIGAAHESSSLAMLAALIAPGARVLDVGCGSGALGRFLRRRDGAAAGPIDGLTINSTEAALAAPAYRRVEVADLETTNLVSLFGASGGYDTIVCADVLEHMRHPQRVMDATRALLAPRGRALLSIPNASHVGLLAELMAGEWRYRPEGLLDATHLRFFTRRSLLRFLQQSRWQALRIQALPRQLNESEFSAAFDALPPQVARYLLGLPDALSYQFIVQARPLAEGEAAAPTLQEEGASTLEPPQALFTAQLYLGGADGSLDEERKCSTSGVVGEEHQTLRFQLPADAAPTALRLDPADRPGFVHLHEMRLLAASGRQLWHWLPEQAATLLDAPSAGCVLQPPVLTGGAFTLMLYGNDPWLELPVPATALARAAGGVLDVSLGWPMSADFLALAGSVHQHVAGMLRRHAKLARRMNAERDAMGAQLQAAREEHARLLDELLRQGKDMQRMAQRNACLQEQMRQQQALLHSANAGHDEAMRLLQNIEQSFSFRATRPIVHAKEHLDHLLRRPAPAPLPMPLPDTPVAIIVPVYKGLEDTRRCLESVLAAPAGAPWRLLIVDDASPQPELCAWLREFAQRDARIELLVNEENLGFVGSVNRAMRAAGSDDVLLLNSDTEVAGDWLARLRAAAYSAPRIASVTPFSNNATICSWPSFCADNELPCGWDCARLDALMARVNAGARIAVPTGVGFCMYIRRAALDAVGLFDEEHFGRGYGEENDFCCRATQAGWQHLHALDVFVRHFGGVSFGASKKPREAAALQTLRRLHPDYEARVQQFIAADPARLARARACLACATDNATAHPTILAVLHGRGGGTERHAMELAAHLDARAQYLLLLPMSGARVILRILHGGKPGCDLFFTLPGDAQALLDVLRRMGVRHIHYHHFIGYSEFAFSLPQRLGVSYDFTAHDYYTLCPQISLTERDDRYCGEEGEAQCAECLAHRPAPSGGASIQHWRQQHARFLEGARFLIAPSRDALARLLCLAPAAHHILAPHTDIAAGQALPVPSPAPLTGSRALKVAVIGAMSRIKGADVLEEAAIAAKAQGLPVEFHLLGYGYRDLQVQPHAALTVHGRYSDDDLPALLRWLAPDVVWFPAQWPETYSYTLSACLLAGLPVVAPSLGAFAERLAGRRWTWVCDWQQTPQQWLEFFCRIRTDNFAAAHAPAPFEPIAHAHNPAHAIPLQDSAEWYRSTYLDGIPPAEDASAPGDEVLKAHLSGYGDGLARNLPLRLISWLRHTALLDPLARAIPARWKTRIKALLG